MLTLALRRNLIGFREDLQAGAWQQAPAFCLFTHPIGDLHGATLGLIGYGDLAQGVQRLAEAFGMRVLVAERRGAESIRSGRTAFEQVLAESDVLSLHCPLTAETRGLMGVAELAAMKPGAILINTARGALVDAEAVLTALKAGRLGGAGIDVLPEEPPRNGHPFLEVRLPNLIVTPHIAWASAQAMQAMADQVVDNMEAFMRGKPANRVT
jgi:glycerate dehydrogenase